MRVGAGFAAAVVIALISGMILGGAILKQPPKTVTKYLEKIFTTTVTEEKTLEKKSTETITKTVTLTKTAEIPVKRQGLIGAVTAVDPVIYPTCLSNYTEPSEACDRSGEIKAMAVELSIISPIKANISSALLVADGYGVEPIAMGTLTSEGEITPTTLLEPGKPLSLLLFFPEVNGTNLHLNLTIGGVEVEIPLSRLEVGG